MKLHPTEFIDNNDALNVAKRDVPKGCKVTLIDASEVGNDEGADVLVMVVGVDHPAMPDLKIEAYTDHRFYVFKRGQEHAAFSGNI